MKTLITIVLALSFSQFFVSVTFAQSQNEESNQAGLHKRILFVGNSFSFYNNGVHNHLGNLLRVNDEWVRGQHRFRLLTLSGGHVYEQLETIETHLTTHDRGYTAVVIQGHSNEPLLENKKERFEEGLTSAVRIIREKGVEPIVFMTWAYKESDGMIEALTQAYQKMGAKLDIAIVPVGLAFAKANQQLPDIELYSPDISGIVETSDPAKFTFREDVKHPSVAGTYLAALVFYSFLFEASPVGIPYYAGLSKSSAEQLQALSWNLVSDYLASKH